LKVFLSPLKTIHLSTAEISKLTERWQCYYRRNQLFICKLAAILSTTNCKHFWKRNTEVHA